MGIQIDFTQIDDPNDVQSVPGKPKPGRGMVVVTKFEEYGGRAGNHLLEFEIVAWTDQSCVGMTQEITIWTDDKFGDGGPQRVMTALGIAGGLFTPADVAMWKARGHMEPIDFNGLVDRPMMVHLIEKGEKKFLNVANGGKAYYHILDPRVKDWPKNAGIFNAHAAKVGEYKKAETPASQSASSVSSASSAEAPPFSTADEDPFSAAMGG